VNDQLPGLIDEARAVAAEAQETFGHLSAEQVNWKPHAGEWSVAQCFEHLIAINSAYFPLIRKIARGEHRPSLRERLPLLPRLFGSMVLKAVQPGAPRKFKTILHLSRPAARSTAASSPGSGPISRKSSNT
jgi:hypothetical protein